MRISVAMTNYNYGGYVGAAIESVLAQTRAADQIVLVDDGSTDESRRVIGQYASRVIAVSTENRGVVAATNEALAHCDGEIVAFLDADDLLVPSRLRSLAAVYEADQDVQWVFNGIRRVDRATLQPLAARPGGRMISGRHDVRSEMRSGSIPLVTPPSSGLSFRMSLIADFLPIPDGGGNQDTFLALLAMARSVGHVLAEPLSLQGIHGENRFSAYTGKRRDRHLANHYLWMATGYDALGSDLHALADNFTARALTGSRMGMSLPSEQRRRLRVYLASLDRARYARIAKFLTRRMLFGIKRRVQRARVLSR